MPPPSKRENAPPDAAVAKRIKISFPCGSRSIASKAAKASSAVIVPDDTLLTTGEATVTSYEIFDSAQGYPAKEGYEWRVVKMEVRFYDENTGTYGCQTSATIDDYYNSKLHSDTFKQEDKTDQYTLYSYHIIHAGQETEGFCYFSASWGDWYKGKAGNDEIIRYLQWDFLVPAGYDGSVAVLRDARTQWPDDAYITDLDPADFLLFRAD